MMEGSSIPTVHVAVVEKVSAGTPTFSPTAPIWKMGTEYSAPSRLGLSRGVESGAWALTPSRSRSRSAHTIVRLYDWQLYDCTIIRCACDAVTLRVTATPAWRGELCSPHGARYRVAPKVVVHKLVPPGTSATDMRAGAGIAGG